MVYSFIHKLRYLFIYKKASNTKIVKNNITIDSSKFGSLVTQLGKELVLIQVPILIAISLFNKLQNIIVTDVNIQILIKHTLYIIQSHQSSLFSIK